MKTTSQVSFRFDGSHNIPYIKDILKTSLTNCKTSIEEIGRNLYRVYVASDNTDYEVFKVCYRIQCFCVYDKTKQI